MQKKTDILKINFDLKTSHLGCTSTRLAEWLGTRWFFIHFSLGTILLIIGCMQDFFSKSSNTPPRPPLYVIFDGVGGRRGWRGEGWKRKIICNLKRKGEKISKKSTVKEKFTKLEKILLRYTLTKKTFVCTKKNLAWCKYSKSFSPPKTNRLNAFWTTAITNLRSQECQKQWKANCRCPSCPRPFPALDDYCLLEEYWNSAKDKITQTNDHYIDANRPFELAVLRCTIPQSEWNTLDDVIATNVSKGD